MPRKQRFKPSRKQPSNQQQPPVDKHEEVHPDEVSVENEMPSRGRSEDSDIERSH
jgi:hypothetical protein